MMAECGLCRDCKWYIPINYGDEEGTCKLMGGYDCEPKIANTLAYSDTDAPEESTWVIVRPTFGCVQFEAKGEEK